MALAMEWTARITTIALEMVLPGVLGLWIDQQCGTKMLFLLLGLILGFSAGLWQLVKLAKSAGRDGNPPREAPRGPQRHT